MTSLSCIGLSFYHFHNWVLIIAFPAYTLNLRGSDIPYNPLFHSYLFISLDKSYLFVESAKLHPDVIAYLNTIDVEQRNYTDLWPFLRRRLWGEGKVLIAPQTSYAISLMLTHVRYTVAPSYIEMMMSVKNETEIDGMRRAYLRDGVSYVSFFSVHTISDPPKNIFGFRYVSSPGSMPNWQTATTSQSTKLDSG